MLQSLHVKNLALIDEIEVTFGEGLNILTGETGAGKSIIIGSINLALGAKADKDMIRTGAEYALVELVFTVEGQQLAAIEELELPVEDGQIILQRRILQSRNVCKVCGETVTARQLKQLGEILLDIHGQHEHQSLLKPAKQLEILDAYAGEALCLIRKNCGNSTAGIAVPWTSWSTARWTKRRGRERRRWRNLNARRLKRRPLFPGKMRK